MRLFSYLSFVCFALLCFACSSELGGLGGRGKLLTDKIRLVMNHTVMSVFRLAESSMSCRPRHLDTMTLRLLASYHLNCDFENYLGINISCDIYFLRQWLYIVRKLTFVVLHGMIWLGVARDCFAL